MDTDPTLVEPGTDTTDEPDTTDDAHLMEDELLVEEISIDGMCGVY